MKKFFFLAVLISLTLLLVGGGFIARFEDIAFQKDKFEAGTLEFELLQAAWKEQDNNLSPTNDISFTFDLKNVASLPFSYRVSATVKGDLDRFVTVNFNETGLLDPDEEIRIVIPVTLPAGVDASSEGRSGKLEITVEAYQDGLAEGFTDKAVIEPGFSTLSSPPQVEIADPAAEQTLSGKVLVVVNASDEYGIKEVILYFDSDGPDAVTMTPIGPGVYQAAIDSALVEDGAHTLIAVASDISGQSATDTRLVYVSNASP